MIDPISLDDYIAHGGYEGLKRAATMSAAQIVDEVVESGLRGRGGAGFPCGIKLRTAMQTAVGSEVRGVQRRRGRFRNLRRSDDHGRRPLRADRGDDDRRDLRRRHQGYIYLRSEYPHAARTLAEAIAAARARGYLGANVLATGKRFELEVRIGAGSYICGEETAMLESLEGKRGMVRYKPPVPAISGLFGKPTVINNVLTLASMPDNPRARRRVLQKLRRRPFARHAADPIGRQRRRPGLIEKAFGVTLRDIVYEYGGGTSSGRPVRAVQVGGPLGAYFPESMLDVALDYEELAARNGLLGHGGVVVFDDTVNMAEMARYAMEFCAQESCGKCTPCRIGSTRGVEVIDRIIARQDQSGNLALLRDLCDTMTNASLCALGGLTPLPVLSALKYFPRDFGLGDDAVSGMH